MLVSFLYFWINSEVNFSVLITSGFSALEIVFLREGWKWRSPDFLSVHAQIKKFLIEVGNIFRNYRIVIEWKNKLF